MSAEDTDEVIAGLVMAVNRQRAEIEWRDQAFEVVSRALEVAATRLADLDDGEGIALIRATMEEWGLSELKARRPSTWV